MNKNYVAGRNFEYKRKKWWEGLGYVVLRSSGSHGFADLTAIKPGYGVTFIQCKIVKTEAEGNRLISKFVENPPIIPGNYHLAIEVYVKNLRKALSKTI